MLVLRDLQFRSKRSDTYTITGAGPLSFHSAVWTGSSVALYGGSLRGSDTSAAFLYDHGAPTPELGLAPLPIVADSPAARGYPGLIQASSMELLVFGGAAPRAGSAATACAGGCCAATVGSVWDMWRLDLSNQAWRAMPEDTAASAAVGAALLPVALGAFSSVVVGGETYIVLHGGVSCGYTPGLTFASSAASCGSAYACPGRLTDAIQLVVVGSAAHSAMRYRRASAATAGLPSARCFHTAQSGAFAVGEAATLFYGGVDAGGRALMDLWVAETGTVSAVHLLSFAAAVNGSIANLGNWASSLVNVLSSGPECLPEAASVISAEASWVLAAGMNGTGSNNSTGKVLIRLFGPEEFLRCTLPLLAAPAALERVAANLSLVPAPVVDAVAVAKAAGTAAGPLGPVAEVRFDIHQYDTRSAADGCKRREYRLPPMIRLIGLEQQGLKASFTCFTVNTTGLRQRFNSRQPVHPESRQIYKLGRRLHTILVHCC
jgi:hypothetical protein